MNLFTTERNNCRRRLIMLVKKHPILWNKQQEDYKRNRPKKLQTWQSIANQMGSGSTSDKIRRTWENLRDQYRRDLKRQLKYGFTSKWRFFSDMDFLRDMVTCKESQTELTDSDSDIEAVDLPAINCTNTTLAKPITPTNPDNLNQTPTTSQNAGEFRPIFLSKQWQKDKNEVLSMITNLRDKLSGIPSGENQTDSTEKITASCDCSQVENGTGDAMETAAHTSNASLTAEQHPMSLVSVSLENPIKTEPNFDIDVEEPQIVAIAPPRPLAIISTPFDMPPATKDFQEAQVTTSSQRHTLDVPEEPKELRPSTSAKKRKNSESDVDCKDEDYYFVMSLLPSLRQIPSNKKFALRIGIMNLIAKDLKEVCK